MSKKHEIQPFQQQDLDLMFWQYSQGVKDVIEKLPIALLPTNEAKVETINSFIKAKFVHIHHLHNGRHPSFDLKAEVIMGKIEIKKTLI